jgi:hypothetical protein
MISNKDEMLTSAIISFNMKFILSIEFASIISKFQKLQVSELYDLYEMRNETHFKFVL